MATRMEIQNCPTCAVGYLPVSTTDRDRFRLKHAACGTASVGTSGTAKAIPVTAISGGVNLPALLAGPVHELRRPEGSYCRTGDLWTLYPAAHGKCVMRPYAVSVELVEERVRVWLAEKGR